MVRKRKRGKVSFIESIIQGAVGKKYVIKHYRYGIIKTKFPDMTRIKASAKQRKCRNTFAEAVAYSKTVIADTQLKKDWQKKLRRRNGLWNEAIKYYLVKLKQAKLREALLIGQLIRQAFNNDHHTPVPFTSIKSSLDAEIVEYQIPLKFYNTGRRPVRYRPPA